MPITEQQRERRRRYLGSSDMPVIMNRSPFSQTATHVYWSKVEKLPPDAPAEYMDIGNWLEVPLIMWAAEQLGVTVACNVFRERDIFCANHDALVQRDEEEGIEAKYANAELAKAYGREGTDQVPDHVVMQAQHQMYVSALDRVHVALAVPSNWSIDRRLYVVRRDEELIMNLVAFGRQWWAEHVVKRVPPKPKERPPLYVLKALRRTEGKQVQLTDRAVELADQRAELKQQVKAVQSDIDAVDGELIWALGDAEVGLLPDGRKITYHQYGRSTFDTKRFKAQHPEMAAEYLKQSQYRTLYVKEAKHGK